MKSFMRDIAHRWSAGTCASVSPMRGITRISCAVVALLATALLALLLSAATPVASYADEPDEQTQQAMQQLEEAFTDAYNEAQEEDGVTADEASPLTDSTAENATASDDDSAPAEETIEDDENPLAESPYASPVNDFVWVLLAAIIVVAAFFLVSTGRLNKNIEQMRRFVD